MNSEWEARMDGILANISVVLQKLSESERKYSKKESSETYYEDNSNAYLYILFVLTFYAFSIVVLMVKYIRREREGSKLEFYYTEFVKRDWYKDKNLYDSTGRRIYFTVEGNRVLKVAKQSSRMIVSEDENGTDLIVQEVPKACEMTAVGSMADNRERKKSVVLCVESATTAMSILGLPAQKKDPFENLGAKPKSSSMRKKWPPRRGFRQASFHQQSLEEALELRNVNSLENLRSPYAVAKRIDHSLSFDIDSDEYSEEESTHLYSTENSGGAEALNVTGKPFSVPVMLHIDEDDETIG